MPSVSDPAHDPAHAQVDDPVDDAGAALADALARFARDGVSPVLHRVAGRPDRLFATFLRSIADGEGETLMISGFVNGGATPRLLQRHGGADPDGHHRDVAARTWELPGDVLSTYLFWVGAPGLVYPETLDELLPVLYGPDGGPRPDPGNPDRFVYPVDPEHPGPPFVQSVLRGPDAPPEPFLGAPMLGELTEHRLASAHLGDERRVWVHVSTGAATSPEPPMLVVVFDGGVYAHLMHTPEQVDAMVATGELPPAVTLYCHYASDASRNAELACREDFAAFVVDELVPWAATRWRFTTDAARTIVAGASLGGLAAGWLAYRHPDRFGNALAQSVPWGFHPDQAADQASGPTATGWLAERWTADGPRGAVVYTEMGTFETGLAPDGVSAYDHTLRFVDALRSLGVSVDFQPYSGGHDHLAWRATFARGLRSIAARRDLRG